MFSCGFWIPSYRQWTLLVSFPFLHKGYLVPMLMFTVRLERLVWDWEHGPFFMFFCWLLLYLIFEEYTEDLSITTLIFLLNPSFHWKKYFVAKLYRTIDTLVECPCVATGFWNILLIGGARALLRVVVWTMYIHGQEAMTPSADVLVWENYGRIGRRLGGPSAFSIITSHEQLSSGTCKHEMR